MYGAWRLESTYRPPPGSQGMTPPQPFEAHGRLRRQISQLPELVTFIRRAMRELGLGEEIEYGLQLVAEELFTNMVKYGADGEPEVMVHLFADAQRLRMVFEDPGAHPYDPTMTPPRDLDRPAQERRPGGLGVHLVRTYMDEFSYEHTGSTGLTTVTKKLGPPHV